jgi:hypothetical protein
MAPLGQRTVPAFLGWLANPTMHSSLAVEVGSRRRRQFAFGSEFRLYGFASGGKRVRIDS